MKLSLVLMMIGMVHVGFARYVAIPIDDLQVVEVTEGDHFNPQGHVVVRRAVPQDLLDPEESESRYQRQAGGGGGGGGGFGGGGHEYVDYSAYTGGHGAFGWHSDHPVGHY